mmetsp:Transcript_28534/g.62811  ORF Transcript_28534/g.62811 Transcript_28534/m.62811 type:complete len:208 (-) Transcript_28534:538-1161(-)
MRSRNSCSSASTSTGWDITSDRLVDSSATRCSTRAVMTDCSTEGACAYTSVCTAMRALSNPEQCSLVPLSWAMGGGEEAGPELPAPPSGGSDSMEMCLTYSNTTALMACVLYCRYRPCRELMASRSPDATTFMRFSHCPAPAAVSPVNRALYRSTSAGATLPRSTVALLSTISTRAPAANPLLLALAPKPSWGMAALPTPGVPGSGS